MAAVLRVMASPVKYWSEVSEKISRLELGDGSNRLHDPEANGSIENVLGFSETLSQSRS